MLSSQATPCRVPFDALCSHSVRLKRIKAFADSHDSPCKCLIVEGQGVIIYSVECSACGECKIVSEMVRDMAECRALLGY